MKCLAERLIGRLYEAKLTMLHYGNVFISLWLISSIVNTHIHSHIHINRFLLQQAGVVTVAAVPPETMRGEGRETKPEY